MEDEIDLCEYVAVLLRHWRLIAGLAVVAAIIPSRFRRERPPARGRSLARTPGRARPVFTDCLETRELRTFPGNGRLPPKVLPKCRQS